LVMASDAILIQKRTVGWKVCSSGLL